MSEWGCAPVSEKKVNVGLWCGCVSYLRSCLEEKWGVRHSSCFQLEVVAVVFSWQRHHWTHLFWAVVDSWNSKANVLRFGVCACHGARGRTLPKCTDCLWCKMQWFSLWSRECFPLLLFCLAFPELWPAWSVRTAQFLAAGTQILDPDYNEIENCIPFSSLPIWLPRTGGRYNEPGLSLSGWGGMEDWEYCQADQPCHLSRLPQCYQALFVLLHPKNPNG